MFGKNCRNFYLMPINNYNIPCENSTVYNFSDFSSSRHNTSFSIFNKIPITENNNFHFLSYNRTYVIIHKSKLKLAIESYKIINFISSYTTDNKSSSCLTTMQICTKLTLPNFLNKTASTHNYNIETRLWHILCLSTVHFICT